MADFKRQGGALTGREERYDGFEGEPRGVGSAVGTAETSTGSGLTGSNRTTDNSYDDTTTTGKKPSLMDRLNPMKDTDGDGKKGVMN